MLRRVLLLATLVLSLSACGGGDEETNSQATQTAAAKAEDTNSAGPPVEFPLRESNDSGQSGTASLRAVDATSFEVVLDTSEATKYESSFYLAHVHDVTCADYAKIPQTDDESQEETISDELQDVIDGESESTVYAPLDQRTTGEYSINVHSQFEGYIETSCGDIPKH